VRREEVEEGTRILHTRWPSIKALRDATEAQLKRIQARNAAKRLSPLPPHHH